MHFTLRGYTLPKWNKNRPHYLSMQYSLYAANGLSAGCLYKPFSSTACWAQVQERLFPTLCRSERLNESLSLCKHKHSIMQALAKTFTQALLLTTRALLMLISQISSPLHTFRRYLLIQQECCHSFSHFLAVRGEWLGGRLSGTVHGGAAFDGDRGNRWFFLWDSLSLL